MPNVARRLETTTRPYTCHTYTHIHKHPNEWMRLFDVDDWISIEFISFDWWFLRFIFDSNYRYKHVYREHRCRARNIRLDEKSISVEFFTHFVFWLYSSFSPLSQYFSISLVLSLCASTGFTRTHTIAQNFGFSNFLSRFCFPFFFSLNPTISTTILIHGSDDFVVVVYDYSARWLDWTGISPSRSHTHAVHTHSKRRTNTHAH